MKKISIITPCYNSEKFIKDCINSVSLLITLKDFEFEHLVVDDGSSDKTWEIISAINLPRLKTLKLDKNRGQSAARNFALQKSDADYIFFLDSDDVVFESSMHGMFNFAERENTQWIYGDFLRGNENLSYLIGQDYYGTEFKSTQELLVSIFFGKHFFQQNGFFSRGMLENLMGFDESLRSAEDLDLSVRLLISGALPSYKPGALYMHRFHQNNVSVEYKQNKNLHFENLSSMFYRYYAELKKILPVERLGAIEDNLAKFRK